MSARDRLAALLRDCQRKFASCIGGDIPFVFPGDGPPQSASDLAAAWLLAHGVTLASPAPDALRAALEPFVRAYCEDRASHDGATLFGIAARLTLADFLRAEAVVAAAPRGPEPNEAAIEAAIEAYARARDVAGITSRSLMRYAIRAAFAAQVGAAPGGPKAL